MKIQVCLLGLGRTGKEVAAELLRQPDIQLAAVFCTNSSPKVGKDVGEILNMRETGIPVLGADMLEEFLKNHRVDVAIDFTRPEATLSNSVILAQNKVRVVVGTTGFSPLQVEKLKAIAEKYKTGIVYAPNITLGVNVLMVLTNLAASILDGYDCCVLESHFRQKADSPSATAKKIAKEAEMGLEYRDEKGDVPILAVRAGGIVGVHKVVIAGEYDQIELQHESFSRKAFALGAVKAARKVVSRVGFFEMSDVLDLKRVMESYLRRSESAALEQIAGR